MTGATAEAVAEYQRAVEADPSDFEAHFGLAELLIGAGRRAEAIPHLRTAAGSSDPALREAARTRLSALR